MTNADTASGGIHGDGSETVDGLAIAQSEGGQAIASHHDHPSINDTGGIKPVSPRHTPQESAVNHIKTQYLIAVARSDEGFTLEKKGEHWTLAGPATPAETAKFLQAEVEKWEKVITAAGVKIES